MEKGKKLNTNTISIMYLISQKTFLVVKFHILQRPSMSNFFLLPENRFEKGIVYLVKNLPMQSLFFRIIRVSCNKLIKNQKKENNIMRCCNKRK